MKPPWLRVPKEEEEPQQEPWLDPPFVTGKAVPLATDKFRVSPKRKAIEAVSIVTKKVRVLDSTTDAAHEIGFPMGGTPRAAALRSFHILLR